MVKCALRDFSTRLLRMAFTPHHRLNQRDFTELHLHTRTQRAHADTTGAAGAAGAAGTFWSTIRKHADCVLSGQISQKHSRDGEDSLCKTAQRKNPPAATRSTPTDPSEHRKTLAAVGSKVWLLIARCFRSGCTFFFFFLLLLLLLQLQLANSHLG